MTIFYKFDGQMYINITNGCPCDCVFCLRNNSDSVKDNEQPVAGARAFLRGDRGCIREIR